MNPFTLNLVGSCLHLTLFGEITIQCSRSLADELKATLRPEHTLEIDASELSRLDASGLQILLASAQVAADTCLVVSSPAWTAAFNRYASPDPFRAP